MSEIDVISTNISEQKGTVKRPVEQVTVDEHGVVGDAHAGPWHRQVSLLSAESIERFERTAEIDVAPGEFAENLTVRGADLCAASILDRFRIGTVELEITQIGKECHGDDCAIYQKVGKCVMPTEGVFCRVLSGGVIRPGATGEYLPKTLNIRVITLSDRASEGEYSDESGPRIRDLLDEHFEQTRWRTDIQTSILPDEARELEWTLHEMRNEGADIIITTGGTGVGPRDITPDVVTSFCDKTVPGIMEMIRVKYGADNPNALLSRSIAGVASDTLVYALPGSVKAVEEYMAEILLTMEHMMLTAKGLEVH
ncbi:MAG: molybdenum cofactor synthesis domain-containing protein [Armatimonadota bacterium]